MLLNKTWEVGKLGCQLQQITPARYVYQVLKLGHLGHLSSNVSAIVVAHPLGQLIYLIRRKVECLPKITDHAPDLVCANRTHEGRFLPAVPCMHAQDQLLTDVPREVEINVGGTDFAVLREKSVKTQTDARAEYTASITRLCSLRRGRPTLAVLKYFPLPVEILYKCSCLY